MSSHMLKPIYIIGAKRTPFGAFGGKLKGLNATDLCVHASKAALDAAKLDPNVVDSVMVGNVLQTSRDAAYISRHVQLRCGIPIDRPALTVNRLCGSGFQSVINGAQEIQLGEANVTLCAGGESMSQAPLAAFGEEARFGVPFGKGLQLRDTLWDAVLDSYANISMGGTAENLAEKYAITKEECDSYALRSQESWAKANEARHFDAEMAPIQLSGSKAAKEDTFAIDETPRSTSMEKLAKLKPVFKKNGVVTAGNASGLSDGAGCIILASEEALKQHELTPLAKILGYHVSGVDPAIMGFGPVPAVRTLLAKTNLKLQDIDVLEFNEAFAAQTLSCVKKLEVDMNLINRSGGAISLGHPLGASGSRIIAHVVHTLARTGKKYGIGTACIGGGQGVAILLENTA